MNGQKLFFGEWPRGIRVVKVDPPLPPKRKPRVKPTNGVGSKAQIGATRSKTK